MSKAPTILVGVLTHNPVANMRWPLVERTLESIRKAFPASHIVVCDNGSTDGTSQMLARPEVSFSFTAEPDDGNVTPARGRNVLAKTMESFGADIWVMSDDDIVWHPLAGEILNRLWTSMPPERLVLVSCLREPEYSWSKKLGEWNIAGITVENRATAPAAAWCFQAKNWGCIGPFPEDGLVGEDVQVCQRLTADGYAVGQLSLAEHIGQGYSLCGNDSARERFAGGRR